jgi:hypothetical protein
VTGDGWIVVPNWDKFQHYSDRNPVWIKVYLELNSRDDWRRLTFAQRGLLVSIWTEYGRSNGRLRSLDLWGRVGQRDTHGNLEALNDAGFIRFVASEPLALARSREKEKETEKKERQPAVAKPGEPGRINMPPVDETAYVRGLVANHVITEPFELDAYNLTDTLRAELEAQLR